MPHAVLVTGIGGNVGQGVLRNIRRCAPEVRIVGTDVVELTAGRHFCDRSYRVPRAHEPSFRQAMTAISREESVNLIIPTTDVEAYQLALFRNELPTLLTSPANVTGMCLDKYLTATHFHAAGIPFAETMLPSAYDGRWGSVVVKPREGRGSRDIHRDPPDIRGFDDTFVVQPWLEGEEITSAFYVLRDRRLHGSITMTRALRHGMTDQCTVTGEHDEVVNAVIQQIVAGFEIAGPCNIQSIVTTSGDVIPFEVNCRYSGTNSIRSQFGFDDVKYGLQEYLFHEAVERPQVKVGSAMRVYLDIIYPDRTLAEIQAGAGDSYVY